MRNGSLQAAAFVTAALLLAACGSPGNSLDRPAGRPAETKASAADPGDASPKDANDGSVIVVTVRKGEVITEDELVELKVGDPVTIEITSDVADEVHVHGYERKAEVKPGKTVVIEFNADIPGTFEVEFEEAGLKLLELQVR